MLHVRVGEVDFHGFTSHGFLLGGRRAFEGWEGRPGLRSERADRASSPGSFVVPAYLSSRLVTLRGTALAESESELEQMEDVLSGLAVSQSRMTVTTTKGTRWAWCRGEDELRWSRFGGTSEAEFELSLFLPDPFKYGEARSFTSTGSDVQLWHRGNTEAWPVITVTGSFPNGYRIVHQNGSFRVTSPLGSGQTDVIDFRRGVVARNGVVQQGVVMAADRKSVPGGALAPMRVEAVTSGSGTAVFSVVDTFV